MTDKVLIAKQMRRALQEFVVANAKDDSQMMEFADLYPEWETLVVAKMPCKAGTTFKWGMDENNEAQLWSFVDDYTPVAEYNPNVDVSHYRKIGWTEDGKYRIWSKPYGPEDAYDKDDIVSYNGKLWKSDRDGNVYCPVSSEIGAWEEYDDTVVEPVEPPKEDENFPTWVQPDKPENGYKKGDIVEHDGKYWISNVDNNIAVPKDGVSEWSVYVSETK